MSCRGKQASVVALRRSARDTADMVSGVAAAARSAGTSTGDERARTCWAASRGVTPKSRLNSRLNCEGLS